MSVDTIAAMRRQMNISYPNYGVLTESMSIDIEYCAVALDSLIHPLVEPEIAVQLAAGLSGGGRNRTSVIRAGPELMPAFEICDTRYCEYRFEAVDNIADNSSAARLYWARRSR